MKFIITESKLETVIFNFLDSLIDIIEFHGDFWFYYKGSNQVVAKYDYEKKVLKTSSWGTKEIADTFSLDRYDESQTILEEWIKTKMGDKMVKEVQITPYTMYLPEYISINLN